MDGGGSSFTLGWGAREKVSISGSFNVYNASRSGVAYRLGKDVARNSGLSATGRVKDGLR